MYLQPPTNATVRVTDKNNLFTDIPTVPAHYQSSEMTLLALKFSQDH